MIDGHLESELIDEIMELAADSRDVARVHEFEELLARADASGQTPHAAIFARSLLAGHLIFADADDIAPVLGLFAETQQLLRLHADELIREVFVPILVQTHFTLIVLLENPAIPLDRVEALQASFEQMCLQNGMTLRGAYSVAMRIAIRRDDHAAAERLFAQLQAQPRDTIVISDTVEDAIEWYTGRGMLIEAMRLYAQATPETEGHYYSSVQIATLIPAIRTGRTELAAQLYDESFDPDDIDSGDAPRLTYLALAGRYDDGLALLPKVLEPKGYDSDRQRAWLAQHAVILLSHVQAAGRGGEQVTGMNASVDDLLSRYLELAEGTARTFDQVNNSDVAVRRLHAFWNEHGPVAGAGPQAASTSVPPTAPPR